MSRSLKKGPYVDENLMKKVKKAIDAAEKSFQSWSETPPPKRGQILFKIPAYKFKCITEGNYFWIDTYLKPNQLWLYFICSKEHL